MGRRRAPSTRLLIVDDHDLAREGLQDMLADEPGIEVVGEAADGREAVALCSRLRPDLVLMDVRIPEMDGLEATRQIRRKLPRTAVMMVTVREAPDHLLKASRVGATGCVLKYASMREIVQAVRGAPRGG